MTMRYPNENKALNQHATPAEKLSCTLRTFELDTLDDLSSDTREFVQRRVLTMDDDSLTRLLLLVDQAKARAAGVNA